MKAKIFIFSWLLLILSCKKENPSSGASGWSRISDRVQMRQSHDAVELKSGKYTYRISQSQLPFKRIVFLNASLIGYVTELGREDRIIGVSSPEYIYSERILNLIKQKKIQNVGTEQKYDVEKILSLRPDALFTNRIESFQNTYDLLKKNGIEVIFLDEYLEQQPLEKMAYLKVFGKLMGMDQAAEVRAAEIASEYHRLKQLASHSIQKPVVLANEMYGNQWFMPGGKTFVAHYIKDAGAHYILDQNIDDKAIPMSFEEVYAQSKDATLWVNVGNHQSKSELLAINPNYAKMNVYQKGKLYAVNAKERGRANDFFESGVVRADLVLKDYIQIFHPGLLPDQGLTYLRELK